MYKVGFYWMMKVAHAHDTKKENTRFHIQEKRNLNQLLK